jgi:hypothetical protein
MIGRKPTGRAHLGSQDLPISYLDVWHSAHRRSFALALALALAPISSSFAANAAVSLGGRAVPEQAIVHASRARASGPKLKTSPNDGLGAAVDISGSIAVVGAPGVRSSSGAVYIFERSQRGWRLQTKLFNPTHSHDQFGNAVAVSGTTIAIGAWSARGGRGLVYIYSRNESRWRQVARFAPAVPPPCSTCGQGDFGGSVAISSDVLVASAYLVGDFSGAVFIYARSHSGSWIFRQELMYPVSGPRPPVEFGAAVAVRGATVVIGALEADDNRGKVFIYSQTGHKWSHGGTLTGTTEGELLGASVSISGTRIAAGGFSTGSNAARGYIFSEHSGRWRQVGYMTTPAGKPGQGGYYTSVAISGIRAIIGDPRPNPDQCGAAYEYKLIGHKWRRLVKIVNPGCASNDFFGQAVALAGRTALIGAPGYHRDAGNAYVQELP